MSFRKWAFVAGALSLAAACGGSAFSGGDTSQAGSSHAGASSSQAGKPGTAGSSSSGGSGPAGGTSAGGGAVAGTTGVGGGANCFAVRCANPLCEDGAEPVTNPGECCPSCPVRSPSCDSVTCQPVTDCGEGYALAQPAGACCPGCVPQPGGVACHEIACPADDRCPLGYVRGDLVGGCCYDCVPDPLFCNDASECVTADRPRSCCGCPEAISQRMYDADECWSSVDAPRAIPQVCYPQVICDALCGMCAPPGPLLCANHRCALGEPK